MFGRRKSAVKAAPGQAVKAAPGRRRKRGMFGAPSPRHQGIGDALMIAGGGLQDAFGPSGGNVAATLHSIQGRQAAEAQAEQQRQLQAQAQQAQAALLQQAQGAGLSQRELLALQTNPGEFGKRAAEHAGVNTIAPDHSVINPNGGFQQAPAARPEAFTLSQGEQRFDGQGNQVAGVSPKPQRSFEQEMALRQAGANRTTVNTGDTGPRIGSIPKGYELYTDPQTGANRLQPIEGGPIARADANRQVRQERAGGTVVQDLGRALENIQRPGIEGELSSGPLAGLTRIVPGTPADVTNQHLQSALSNIGIDQLQAMRDASPTGGALGQIPVQQQKRLEQMLGSLHTQLPDSVLQDNIKRAQNIYLDIIHGESAGPSRHQLSFDDLGNSIDFNAVDAEIARLEAELGGVQ